MTSVACQLGIARLAFSLASNALALETDESGVALINPLACAPVGFRGASQDHRHTAVIIKRSLMFRAYSGSQHCHRHGSKRGQVATDAKGDGRTKGRWQRR